MLDTCRIWGSSPKSAMTIQTCLAFVDAFGFTFKMVFCWGWGTQLWENKAPWAAFDFHIKTLPYLFQHIVLPSAHNFGGLGVAFKCRRLCDHQGSKVCWTQRLHLSPWCFNWRNEVSWPCQWDIPKKKPTSIGKSPFLMGKSTINGQWNGNLLSPNTSPMKYVYPVPWIYFEAPCPRAGAGTKTRPKRIWGVLRVTSPRHVVGVTIPKWPFSRAAKQLFIVDLPIKNDDFP